MVIAMSFSFAFLSFTLFPEVGVDRVERRHVGNGRVLHRIPGEKKEPGIYLKKKEMKYLIT